MIQQFTNLKGVEALEDHARVVGLLGRGRVVREPVLRELRRKEELVGLATHSTGSRMAQTAVNRFGAQVNLLTSPLRVPILHGALASHCALFFRE